MFDLCKTPQGIRLGDKRVASFLFLIYWRQFQFCNLCQNTKKKGGKVMYQHNAEIPEAWEEEVQR